MLRQNTWFLLSVTERDKILNKLNVDTHMFNAGLSNLKLIARSIVANSYTHIYATISRGKIRREDGFPTLFSDIERV
jgi:hypothetical protein